MDDKEQIKKLMQYPEAHALKKEVSLWVEDERMKLAGLDTGSPGFAQQAAGKVEAIQAVERLLSRLGVVSKKELKTLNKTYE